MTEYLSYTFKPRTLDVTFTETSRYKFKNKTLDPSWVYSSH